MGLLDWLFPKASRSDSDFRWLRSEAGNPTGIYRNRRLTVFEQDGGWKFCDAKEGRDGEPYFSGVYDSAEAAKYEAIARVGGQPSRYKTRSQRARERRRLQGRVPSGIQGKAELAAAVKQALAAEPELPELHKLNRKVGTARRRLISEVNRAYSAGDIEGAAKKGERLEEELAALAGVITARIEERAKK